MAAESAPGQRGRRAASLPARRAGRAGGGQRGPGTALGVAAGRRAPGPGSAARQQDHRDHAVRVGAEAAEEAEVLDQHPVRQAENRQDANAAADQPRPGPPRSGRRRQPAAVSAAPATASTRRRPGSRRSRGPRTNEPKPDSRSRPGRAGCEVAAMDWTIEVSEPGWPWSVPCQNPRPGPGLQHGHPGQEHPGAARTSSRARPGCATYRPGSAISAPATRVERGGAGRAGQPAQARGEDPPRDSPNTHTTRPQPALASPASRDSAPRAANSSHRPIPTWIQTAGAPAWTGW